MFLGLVGLIVALIGQFGSAFLIEAGLAQTIRTVGLWICNAALVPIAGGVKAAIEKFMGSNEIEATELDMEMKLLDQ